MSHTVVCCRAPSYRQGVQEAVETIFETCVTTGELNENTNVLIKPNLLAKHAPERAVTTHPAVIEACIVSLQKRGVRNIVVADSSGGAYTPQAMNAMYQKSGLREVCDRLGATLYTECNSAPRKTDGKLMHEFQLIAPVHEADFIINAAKIKTHMMTGMTCGVKNLFGTIPGLQKAEFHMQFPNKDYFGEMLVDLCLAVQPQLTIADGITCMEGDGPAGGDPRELGVVLGGRDPFSLDLAVCQMMGIDPMQVPYLSAGYARGVCENRFQNSWAVGDVTAIVPVADFRLPETYVDIDFIQKVPKVLRWAMPLAKRVLSPRPVIEQEKCIGCGKCAEICPQNVITIENEKAKIHPDGCIHCFCCHEMCPAKAIAVKKNRFLK